MKDKPQSRSLRTSPSVRITETQDGTVLLDVQQGLCFSINPVGTLIWKRVRDGCTVIQIAQHMAEMFSISEEQARSDTQEFLEVLIEKRLVELDDAKGKDSHRHGRFAETFPRLWKRIPRFTRAGERMRCD